MRDSRVRFIRMQGFTAPHVDEALYSALMLQPRIIGVIVAVGVVVQSPSLFLALSVVLLWSTLVPTRNPFDAIYNHAVAGPRTLVPLGTAPAPRRFAMGMAGRWRSRLASHSSPAPRSPPGFSKDCSPLRCCKWSSVTCAARQTSSIFSSEV